MRPGHRALPPFCLIDRYILVEFLRYYLLAMVGFTAFVQLFDGFEKIDTFIDHQATTAEVIRYYLFTTPYKSILVAPVAPLLACFLCLGSMTRFREIITLQAAGVSLYRIFAPIYVLALLTAGGSFVVAEFIMPEANRLAREVMEGDIKGRTLRNLGSRVNLTYLGQDNRVYIIRRYDIPRETMLDATIQEFAEATLVRRLDAQKVEYHDGTWLLLNGIERTFPDGGREQAAPFDTLQMDLPELPEDFAKDEIHPDEMSWPDLQRYTARVRQSGSSAELYETDLHLRIAFPFSNVVVVLIAATLAVQIRRGGVALGFGISLAIAFGYWCAIRAGQVLGHSGTLPPVVAAWLANAIFLGLGVFLLIRARK